MYELEQSGRMEKMDTSAIPLSSAEGRRPGVLLPRGHGLGKPAGLGWSKLPTSGMTELVGCAFKGTLVPLLGTGRNQLKLETLLVLTKASLKTPLLPEQPNLKKHICLNHHTSPLPKQFIAPSLQTH